MNLDEVRVGGLFRKCKAVYLGKLTSRQGTTEIRVRVFVLMSQHCSKSGVNVGGEPTYNPAA